MKDHIEIEQILGGKFRAALGPAHGVAKSRAAAIKACEEAAADILMNVEPVRFEVRSGYLIAHQVESSTSSWYLIRKLTDLASAPIHPQSYQHPRDLHKRIDSHLAQYLADEKPAADLADSDIFGS